MQRTFIEDTIVIGVPEKKKYKKKKKQKLTAQVEVTVQ